MFAGAQILALGRRWVRKTEERGVGGRDWQKQAGGWLGEVVVAPPLLG